MSVPLVQISRPLLRRLTTQPIPEALFPLALLGVSEDVIEHAVSLHVLRQHSIPLSEFIAAVFPADAGASWRMLRHIEKKADLDAMLIVSTDVDPPLRGGLSAAPVRDGKSAATVISATAVDVIDTVLNDGQAYGRFAWSSRGIAGGVARTWLFAEEGVPSSSGAANSVDAGFLVTLVYQDPVTPAALDLAKAQLAAQAVLGWRDVVLISCPDDDTLRISVPFTPDATRKAVHKALLFPNRPLIRLHHARFEADGPSAQPTTASPAWYPKLVDRVFDKLPQQPLAMPKSIPNATTHLVRGPFDYYHYCLDGFDDSGWGCAYRSLQTVLSWFERNGFLSPNFVMPDLAAIQKILSVVDPEKRKMNNFVGSKTWIGSTEVMLVLQHFMPALECQLQRLEHGSQLATDVPFQRRLAAHFDAGGAPVMIGGAAYAHTIVGINCNVRTGEAQYLILDPHYPSGVTDLKVVQQKGWVGWKDAAKFFDQKQWYNLCLPLTNSVDWT